MQVAVHNKVKVYNLTSGKSLPEWLDERKKNKKLAGGEHRIELIHDLEFPHFSRCIFRTPNGSHLFAAGDYPPRIKCFDVNELSMKYSFNADMPILGGVALSSDFRKFALRGEGRQITVHHSAAIVDRIRVPHAQRCLDYHAPTAELLSAGTSHEIFRFNLESGAFVESYKTQSEDGVNHTEAFAGSGLIMAACANGQVEAWDSRAGKCAGVLKVACPGAPSGLTTSAEITSVSTDRNGLLFACGTNQGNVVLYDIRLSRPLVNKDHMNGLPIVKTYFFQGRSSTTGESTHILSADTRSIKVWNKHDGTNFTTVETPADIFDFTVIRSQYNMVAPYECDDSGIICVACDTPRVQVHFIPQLGVAPRWASFLDTITEELEEKESNVVYDDYKFVAKAEMDALGIQAQDVSDGKVRPAMHGCFIENSLYRELKAVVDPGAFNRHVVESKKKKIEEKWGNRISKFKRLEQAGDESDGKGLVAAAAADPRFAGKLSNEAFAMDKLNPEYKKLLQKIDERREKVARRKQRYEDALFNIVPDDGAADGQIEEDAANVDETAEVARKELGRSAFAHHREAAATKRNETPQRKVLFFEANKGANFTATDKQTHEYRKRDRSSKLTLEERLKKTTRRQEN